VSVPTSQGGGTFEYTTIDEWAIDTTMMVQAGAPLDPAQVQAFGVEVNMPQFPIVLNSREQQAAICNGFKVTQVPLSAAAAMRITLIYNGRQADFAREYDSIAPLGPFNGGEWPFVKTITDLPGVMGYKLEVSGYQVSPVPPLHLPITFPEDLELHMSGFGHEEGDPLKRFQWEGTAPLEGVTASIDATELLTRLQTPTISSEGEDDVDFDELDVNFNQRVTLLNTMTIVRVLINQYGSPDPITAPTVDVLLSGRIVPYGEYVQLDDSAFAKLMRIQMLNDRVSGLNA